MDDLELEYKIKVHKETQYKNLYSWCIKETDQKGKDIDYSMNQIPWLWTTYFLTKSITYQPSLSSHRVVGLLSSKKKFKKHVPFGESETIYGKLIPDKNSPTFSMFGTDRKINEFELNINIDEEENCYLWGCPKYTMEIDFLDVTTKDTIWINIGLKESKFKKMSEMILNHSLTSLNISMGYVKGFYSDWSPEGTPSYIKVLTSEHKLDIPKKCDIELPNLGEVGQIDIITNITNDLITDNKIENFDNDDILLDDFENENPQLSNSDIIQKQVVDELIKLRENFDKQQIYIQRYMWLILISIIVIVVILL